MGLSLQEWKLQIESSEKRRLSKNENDFLDRISELLEMLDWKDALHAKDIALLSSDILLKEKDPKSPLTNGLWTSPPTDEYSLWQYLALIFEERDIAIPDFMRAQTRIDEVRAEIADRTRAQETRLWRNRLGNYSQRREFNHTGSLEIRLALSGKTLKWEARTLGFQEYKPLPVKELLQWLSKEFGFLDRFAANSLPLCALLQDYYRSSQRVRIDLDKAEDCALLNLLLHRPDTRDRIVNRNGEPLSIRSKRIVWSSIQPQPDNRGNYQIELRFESGEPTPDPLIFLPGSQALYLHADELFPGPNLLTPNADPNQSIEIPEAAIESAEGLLFLKNQGLPLPDHLKGRIVTLPLKPLLYCNLETSVERRSNDNALKITLSATSRDQQHWFVLTEQGWNPSPNLDTGEDSAIPEEGTLFEFPEATPYLRLFHDFELKEVEQGIWSNSVNTDFPSEFSSWIQSLPTEVQIIADEELDTLVDGKPVGRYALHVTPQENQDWFDIRLEPELIDSTLTESEKALLLRADGEFVYFSGKGWKRFEPKIAPSQQELLRQLGLNDKEAAADTHSFHSLQLADTRIEDAAVNQIVRSIRKRAKDITTQTPSNLPKGIKTTLRPYQEEGFKFLTFLSNNRFGGILADDMGLGKTLQTLTWLTWIKLHQATDETFQCLVVCPKSVMHVWKQEVERHTELLSIATFDPSVIDNVSWQTSKIDILVANYSQLRINRGFFLGQEWTATILDEGQYIKNPQSQTSKVAYQLRAEHRLILTGTPVENRILDLWSLFSFAMPGLLGSKASFTRQYKESDPESPKRLNSRTRHFMLRRSKSQVAPDLPERIEETITCDLEGDQKELYTAELKNVRNVLKHINSDAEFDKERFNILSSLLRLRQICCHPRLVDPAYADFKSSKLEALLDLVTELREEGHKVLIFSQFVEMLGIIQHSLEKLKCKQLLLTGKTQNREALVSQFQTDPDITAFLLSLRAAGSGLNLTAATYVILYDPWWNPAVEAQAIDRAHRIGQVNAVNAYRLIAGNTIEDKIQSLQIKKETLASEVVQEDTLSQVLDLERLKSILRD